MKTKLIIIIITIGALFGSCKKGPNDPAISLRSRKARVVGEWKATAYTSTNSEASGGVTTTSSHTMSSNGTFTEVSGTPAMTTTGTESWSASFVKDGTFKITHTESTTISGFTGTSTTVIEGNWNFSGKIGDDKNKDHIVAKTTKQTVTSTLGTQTSTNVTSYTTNGFDNSYFLDQLSNKKMVWNLKTTTTNTPQGSTVSKTTTDEQNYTWEQ